MISGYGRDAHHKKIRTDRTQDGKKGTWITYSLSGFERPLSERTLNSVIPYRNGWIHYAVGYGISVSTSVSCSPPSHR